MTVRYPKRAGPNMTHPPSPRTAARSSRVEAPGAVACRRAAAQADRFARFEAGEHVRIVRGGSEETAAVVEAPDDETPHRRSVALVQHGVGLDARRSRRL